ncbi:MAG: hypothetical protein V4587_00195, partial [Acidobacteriota bacterium]
MKIDLILGIVRHMLTTLGGGLVAKGTLDGDQLTQGAGAIATLLGIAWSVWAKRASKGNAAAAGTPAAMVAMFLSVAGLLLGTGCQTKLAEGGAYNGDKALYEADSTITGAYDTLHSFVKWEYENRASLKQWPEIKLAADNVRVNAQQWIDTAIAMRDSYVGDPTTQNKDSLATAVRMLRTVLAESAKIITQ